MKTFNVYWFERHKVTVKAKNKEKAIEMAENVYQEKDTFDEITDGPIAYEEEK